MASLEVQGNGSNLLSFTFVKRKVGQFGHELEGWDEAFSHWPTGEH